MCVSEARSTTIRALGKCGAVKELEFLRESFDSTDGDGNGRPLSKTAIEAVKDIQERLGVE
jgi:hypothetical protein